MATSIHAFPAIFGNAPVDALSTSASDLLKYGSLGLAAFCFITIVVLYRIDNKSPKLYYVTGVCVFLCIVAFVADLYKNQGHKQPDPPPPTPIVPEEIEKHWDGNKLTFRKGINGGKGQPFKYGDSRANFINKEKGLSVSPGPGEQSTYVGIELDYNLKIKLIDEVNYETVITANIDNTEYPVAVGLMYDDQFHSNAFIQNNGIQPFNLTNTCTKTNDLIPNKQIFAVVCIKNLSGKDKLMEIHSLTVSSKRKKNPSGSP